jgi:hypothetical protein
MQRYSDMSFLMNLPFEEFLEIIIHASKEMQKSEIHDQWVALLPFMYVKWLKFMPFNEYFDACTGANIDMRPKEQVIDEILKLHGMESLENGNI